MLKISVLTRATAALLLLLIVAAECRRVRLKPTPAVASKSVAATAASDQEEQPQGITRQVVFYAEPDEQNQQQQQQQQSDEEQQQPVIIGSRQAYGRSAVGSGQSLPTQHHHRLKPEQHSKSTQQPPVQTIRNFNKLNDDGSFTFGYEAADGSFKEETRGTDCVVRGKYGYVDPDGNKREFTYVSGNPCDPNAISQEEEDNETFKDDDGNNKSNEENIPRNIPSNRRPPPSYALRPIQQQQQRRPTTTVFQQSYVNSEESAAIASSSGTSEEEQDGQLQLNSAKQPLRPPIYRNNLALTDEEQQTPQVFRPTGRPRLAYHHHQQPSAAETTRLVRPTAASHIVDNQPATTYRPQIIQLPLVTAAPTALYPKQSARPAYIATPSSTPATYFDEQFKKYQLETNLIPSSPPQKTVPPNNNNNNNPIYSTELVYDPNTGQYNTLVYQQIPKAVAPQEINVRQKLPFVSSTTAASASVSPFSPRTTAFSSTTPIPLYQQQLIQQQQANQVQQSQQLYNLQVKQQQSQRFPLLPQSSGFVKPPSRQPFLATGSGEQQQTFVQRYPPDAKLQSSSDGRYPSFESGSFQQPQPFYYLSPSAVAADGNPSLASGQIEAFLRGHNLSF